MQTGNSASISELSSKCTNQFSSIKTKATLLTDDSSKETTLVEGFNVDEFSDSFARFRMWAGNIGALQRDKLSLDHRVRYSDLCLEVIRLLKQLLTTLADRESLIEDSSHSE
jgi:hypothetical protein